MYEGGKESNDEARARQKDVDSLCPLDVDATAAMPPPLTQAAGIASRIASAARTAEKTTTKGQQRADWPPLSRS